MNNDKLNILWTNADPITSELMVMMYVTNMVKREVWKDITVIIWGATAKLVAENSHIQKLIAEAMEVGVEFSACQACAEKLGVEKIIADQGIELKFWGAPLTEIIKNKENLITI